MATAKKTAAKAAKAATKRLAKKGAAKQATRSMPKEGKDPQGGLTAKGRTYFAEKEGSHLRPGVKGPADTPEKMLRKGSFLRRHFAHPRGPMKDPKGEPTRLALSAQTGEMGYPSVLSGVETGGEATGRQNDGGEEITQEAQGLGRQRVSERPGARTLLRCGEPGGQGAWRLHSSAGA